MAQTYVDFIPFNLYVSRCMLARDTRNGFMKDRISMEQKLCGYLALLVLLVGGCVSQESVSVTYDSNQDRSQFSSKAVDVIRTSGADRGAGTQVIAIWASAQCKGESCEPEVVTLHLANTGRNAVWVDYRTVVIKSGAEEFRWDNLTHRDISRVRIGEFTRLTISREDFLQMLRMPEIEGNIGTTPFQLSFKQLQPFREFATAISRDVETPDDIVETASASSRDS